MKSKIFLFLLFAGLIANSQVCFYPHTEYSVGTNTNTKAITSGDFNNDGKQDLAVAVVTPSMVSIVLGNGTGGFLAANTFTITNTQPYAIVSTDFNNDGNADVAVANNGSALQGFTVMLGNGAGGLGAANSYTTTGVNPAGIAAGDFNGDGKKDIAITNTNSSPGTVTVRFGNGNGTFGTAATYTVGSGPRGIVCADVTGDGKADLVTANLISNNITVLFNTGAGAFSVAGTFTTGASTGPTDLVAVDLDGDGDLDIVTANNTSANVSVLLNNASGQYSAPNTYNAGTGPLGIATADFDGDGKADITTSNSSGNNVSVLRGDGVGGFYTPQINFSTATKPVKITCADFNGDGKKDIATANEDVTSDNASILLNSLPGPIAISGPLTTVCAGSVNTLTASGAGNYSWNVGFTTTSISVNPTTTTTYSVTGTNTGCSVTASGSYALNVTALPVVTANVNPSSTVCAGTIITLSGGGATSYVWSGSVTNGVGFVPTGTATYTVTGTDGNGCSNTATKLITVNPLPTVTVSVSPSSTVCAGATMTLSGGGAVSYVWSGGITNGIGFVPSSSATYTVTGTDGNSCSNTATKYITVNQLPLVGANASSSTICAGSQITLTGSNASSYTWSGGVLNGVGFIPASSSTYTVIGTDGNSCTNSASIFVHVSTIATPSICAVSVDSLSKYNIIVWDKTIYTGGSVDTFFVYRDTANNAYGLIGKVPYDSLSMFTDTVRTLYAANGDPNFSSWRYKIAAKDSCGNLSAKSPYHQSIFNQNNSGNFNWSQYQIEGQPQPVPALTNYLFQRDNLSNGNYATIGTLSASSSLFTDPQYAFYQSTATWRVITSWNFSCLATVIDPKNPYINVTNLNSSRSNIYRLNNPVSVKSIIDENDFSISPNPFSETATLRITDSRITNYELRFFDLFGREVFPKVIRNSDAFVISRGDLSDGIYFLQVKTEKGAAVKKLIIQK